MHSLPIKEGSQLQQTIRDVTMHDIVRGRPSPDQVNWKITFVRFSILDLSPR